MGGPVKKREKAMNDNASTTGKPSGLSSAKREDIWALIIAAVVMALSVAAPEAIHTFFKKTLFFF